jgi:multisubunit Na+/H+ antiporter MnhB subunit
MNSKRNTDLITDYFPRDRNLSAEEAGKFDNAALADWLTTVVLVLIVISAALSLGARREHEKKGEAVGVQTTIN